MVYRPGKPRGPSTVPNSYILTTAADASFNDMVKEVDALIKKEGREKDVQWGNKMANIGVANLHCDAEFAAKVKTLPHVGSVEQEHRLYPAKKRPGSGFKL